MITNVQLIAIAPRCPNPDEVAQLLSDRCAKSGVNTLPEVAALIGQLCLECDQFTIVDEVGNGATWHGRGWIQLTGARNYYAASQALDLDLVNHPELACIAENAASIALWFWETNMIGQWAKKGDFVQVTKIINGGLTDYPIRLKYTAYAMAVLGNGVVVI